MEKKGAQKEMKEEREGKMPSPYRLSHFVAPLYVAPSPTPGNAKPTSEPDEKFTIRIAEGGCKGRVSGRAAPSLQFVRPTVDDH